MTWMAGSAAGHGGDREDGARYQNGMRALFLCLMLVSLGGCNALVRQDSDFFEEAGAAPDRFDADNQTCQSQADDYVAYDLKGMSGTHYDRNRAFNAVYVRCMKDRGYRPRPYLENLLPG
jgi:hypothetical protein